MTATPGGRSMLLRSQDVFACRPDYICVASWVTRSKEAELNAFEERERAEETRFAHDEELRFKAMARRDKLLGLWAASLIGKTGEAATNYAAEVLKSDLEAPGDEVVFLKVRSDFEKAGLAMTDHQIHRQMTELMAVAIRQVKTE